MSLSRQETLHSGSRAVEEALHSIAATLERGLFAEEMSLRPGFLQTLDARVKVIATLALLLAVGLSRSLWVLGGLYLLALGLALASAIPAGRQHGLVTAGRNALNR